MRNCRQKGFFVRIKRYNVRNQILQDAATGSIEIRAASRVWRIKKVVSRNALKCKFPFSLTPTDT